MDNLTLKEAREIEIYAQALQDLMHKITGDNGCNKSYDPMTVSKCGTIMHSYAFNLRDGGRRHPVSDYSDTADIKRVMLAEAAEWIAADTFNP